MRPPKPVVLTGYIRRGEDGAFEGICLTLNLAVRARSIEEAETKLHDLIVAYLEDATREGSLDEFVPRRAPFSYYVEYYRFRVLAALNAITDFKLFVESAPNAPAHA